MDPVGLLILLYCKTIALGTGLLLVRVSAYVCVTPALVSLPLCHKSQVMGSRVANLNCLTVSIGEGFIPWITASSG